MLNKIKNHKKVTFLTLSAVIAVAIGATLWLNHTRVAAEPEPMFSFDAAKAPGWWQGATNETSMVVFDNKMDCFAYIDYTPGVVDEQAEVAQLLAHSDIRTSKEDASKSLTLQTSGGPMPYELHQITYTIAKGAEVTKSPNIGFIQLDGGYLAMHSFCDSAKNRTTTYPALEAMYFTIRN